MLCQLLLTGISDLVENSKNIKLGEDYQIVALSMAQEDTLDDLKSFRNKYTSNITENEKKFFHFLLTDSKSLDMITKSTGFKFKYIKQTNDYAHQAALIFLEPNGQIKRYLYGINFQEENVQKALIESINRKERTIIQKAIMFCYQYDPDKNSYVIHSLNLMRIACLLTVIILVIIIGKMLEKEKKRKKHEN